MSRKIGFYICHCGTNIAGKVRTREVVEFIGGQEDVAVARDYKFMCSDPGQEMIQKDIRDLELSRVVVASCSPRLHEKTFQSACGRAGLNPYFFQMACVREHCSWVVEDPAEATRKAMVLSLAAVRRVHNHQGLNTREVPVHPDVLVVGGGIAGIQASLDIAKAGRRVRLVEKEPSIGGHMVQFDKTFPTLDCAACISTPKTVAVSQNPNIHLLTCSEVTRVGGYIGNFRVTVRQKPRYIREDRCTGCGQCAEACPVSVPNQFDENLSRRKAVYRFFPQAVPITFAIEKKDRAPCGKGCPAGVNVQGYVQLIGEGKYREAVQLILERIPLPGVLGRVCPHPCETSCRRADVDSPVSIRELKRFAADRVDFAALSKPEIEDRNEKVAVVGSGPAGLAVAYYLRLKGYRVTIFEAMPVLGGMLRTGIPDYRLPPEVLDREIGHIVGTGVEVRTGARLGGEFTFESLRAEGFGAVFLGIGAHKGLKLGVPGESEFEGVIDAVEYLAEANLKRSRRVGALNTVVIGGGNVAIDAARTALRLGCERVTIVYRRTRSEMPAFADEIEEALAEGIHIHCLAMPVRIVGYDGKVTGIECLRTEPGQPDESGRCRPVPVWGSEFIIPCESVISAIGQETDIGYILDAGVATGRRTTITVHSETMQTAIPYVFAAGDAVSGPATVVEAIAGAHRAVEAIDRYLRGERLPGIRDESRAETGSGAETGRRENGDWRAIPKGLEPGRRAHPGLADPGGRVRGFEEVSKGLSEEDALREAARCINCGVCSECMECVRACERQAIDHSMKEEELELEVGTIILATGYDAMDPTPLSQYGYGRLPEVYTALEFERLNNAVGPTGGRIVMKNGRKPESIGIIHCAGSRDVRHHPYCSRVCCMYALKYGHLIKEKVGHECNVYNFYIDMRCYGKGYEEFYRRIQEEGVTFVRGRPAEIIDTAQGAGEEGRLAIVVEDTLIGRKLRVPVDMAVLCTAMEPREDASEVARVFGISQGGDGFFLEEHPKLGPFSTATEGVFLAGSCQGPKDIPDAVSHASGAASQALALVTRGSVEISPMISFIDPCICSGCQTCIGLCAYSAIEFDERRKVSVVNEAVCKGCGSCAGFCPSGAARVRHFTAKQVFAEIEGILEAI